MWDSYSVPIDKTEILQQTKLPSLSISIKFTLPCLHYVLLVPSGCPADVLRKCSYAAKCNRALLCHISVLNLFAYFLFSGDNILAVLRYLVMSEKLADSSEYRHGNMVFFDLLGVVVVAYPARVGTILNYMVATATFLYLAKKASLPGNGGRSQFPVMDICYVISCTGCVCFFPLCDNNAS